MAIGILAAGVVLIFIRRVVGDALIDSLTTLPQNRDAGHAIWWVATERLGAANLTTVCIGLLLLVGTWFAGPGRRATTSRRNLTPYLRDPAVAYGSYAAVILVLLVWAPVPAASDPITASILIVLGAIGVEALRRLVIREFPDVTERDLGHRLHTWASSLGQTDDDAAGQLPAAAAPADRYADLERLAALHKEGVLTDAEFAREKTALLGA